MPGRLQLELKQSRPFASLQSEATVALLRTAALLDHALNEALRPHGLTSAQYNVLRILRGAGEAGLCSREVGDRMIAPVPDVTRMLSRMESAGWIRRDRDSDDRRHVSVRITALGRRRLQEVGDALVRVHHAFLAPLSSARLEQLITLLEEVRHA